MSVYSQKVLALIPARSGSKGIPDKNVKSFCGKPLMAHSIEQAKSCPSVNRVVVSTDSAYYATIAREFGAEIPFLRPAGISEDNSTDLEVFQHALNWLLENEGSVPSVVVHLRPTYPNRKRKDIETALDLLFSHPEWDSVRSVAPTLETPYKMWFRRADGTLVSAVQTDIPEAHSQPRQILPAVFLQNACVDVIRSKTILEKGSISGSTVGSYLMQDCHDIDTSRQFQAASEAFVWNGVPTNKTFVIDIDGVIAATVLGNDYAQSTPMRENIRRVNRLREVGNKIILFTARGSVTGINWLETTQKQLSDWGVTYDDLQFGKPAADYYVDDRLLSLDQFALLDRAFSVDPRQI